MEDIYKNQVRYDQDRKKLRKSMKHTGLLPNELTHYGVPGMKWGVRKQKPHSDSIIKRPRTKKGIRQMSNKEMQRSINRLQLESNYKRLRTSKTGVNKFVSEVVREIAKDSVKSGIKNTVKVGVKATDKSLEGTSAGAQIAKAKKKINEFR